MTRLFFGINAKTGEKPCTCLYYGCSEDVNEYDNQV